MRRVSLAEVYACGMRIAPLADLLVPRWGECYEGRTPHETIRRIALTQDQQSMARLRSHLAARLIHNTPSRAHSAILADVLQTVLIHFYLGDDDTMSEAIADVQRSALRREIYEELLGTSFAELPQTYAALGAKFREAHEDRSDLPQLFEEASKALFLDEEFLTSIDRFLSHIESGAPGEQAERILERAVRDHLFGLPFAETLLAISKNRASGAPPLFSWGHYERTRDTRTLRIGLVRASPSARLYLVDVGGLDAPAAYRVVLREGAFTSHRAEEALVLLLGTREHIPRLAALIEEAFA